MENPILLFTPGPLNTALETRQAMLADYGSRDARFVAAVQQVRSQLLRHAGLSQQDGWEAVIMQGSGTFGVESAIGSSVPRTGRLLVLANGAYGERIATMAATLGIDHAVYRTPENEAPTAAGVDEFIGQHGPFTHLAAVHGETTTGIFNPITELGQVARARGLVYLIDAMSTFGGVVADWAATGAQFIISSSNKCVEGVPGFSFVICKKENLLACKGQARSLSLDLHAQWAALEGNGQFRFTPPTHVIMAFHKALELLDQEGGVPARQARYQASHQLLVQGMEALGFRAYLPAGSRGHIITTFHYPASPAFVFEDFYRLLSDHGLVIYPGKLTQANCFRVGNIGQLYPADIQTLLDAIPQVLAQMGVAVPVA